jgi:hypothetical protein
LTQCAALLSELADLERQIDQGLACGQPRPAVQIVARLKESEATACALLGIERRDEARGAAARSLALDGVDAVAQAVMRQLGPAAGGRGAGDGG